MGGWHPGVDEVIDAGSHHPDQFSGRAAACHSPVYQVEQRREQPVVQCQVSAEVRERPRVGLVGAQPHGAQPVGAQCEDHFLPGMGRLYRPAQPGSAAPKRRVVIELAAPLDRGQRTDVHPAEVKGAHVCRGAKEGRGQILRGFGSEYFQYSRLSQIVAPWAAAAGRIVLEGGMSPGLDYVPIG
jgi:hypothetical protein